MNPNAVFDEIAEDFGPHIADRFIDQIERSMVAMEGFEKFLDDLSDTRYQEFFYAPVDNTSLAIH